MARPSVYRCNENYFNNINSSNRAYILGFIWADGSLSRRGGLTIAIKLEDISILEFIKKELDSNVPIKVYEIKGKSYCKLSINRILLYEALEKQGLGKNKSKNNAPIPNIPAPLLRHFLRGLFDGDGSIWKNDGYRANFSGGNNFLLWVKDQLHKFGIETNNIRFRYKENFNSCSLNITGRENIEKLKNLLYKNAGFCLQRKLNRFNEATKYYENLDKNNWRINGTKESIQELLSKGFYPKKISELLGLNFHTVRRIVPIIKKENVQTS